jgi:hypothetical protein
MQAEAVAKPAEPPVRSNARVLLVSFCLMVVIGASSTRAAQERICDAKLCLAPAVCTVAKAAPDPCCGIPGLFADSVRLLLYGRRDRFRFSRLVGCAGLANRLLNILQFQPMKNYPLCVKSHGRAFPIRVPCHAQTCCSPAR